MSSSPNDLSVWLQGSASAVARREKLMAIVAAEPLFDYSKKIFMSRSERFYHGVAIAGRLMELKREHGLTLEEHGILRAMVGDGITTIIHDSVFTPALLTQSSDEQLAKWWPLVSNYAIFGSYAQTELAHGSNVRALQTEAVLDKATDEFVLHTPSVEAIKWWIGGLGKMATHSIVWARLLIDGKDNGVQPFMVQIRDLKTHKALPGVTVGDIGPKFGFAGVDNGFLKLDHVRIPRTDMLCRNTQVSKDGKVQTANRALSYGGMLAVRAGMVRDAGESLARAVTVAIRYSAFRRQGGGPLGKETIILDYNVQQYRLFPLLATAYALQATGFWIADLHKKLQASPAGADQALLQDMHAASAGLKSLCSTLAANGMEESRKAIGGHGYSQMSGLPDLYATYVHINTAEGDNYLMTQQTTRYLLKQLQAVQQPNSNSKLSEQTQYLKKTLQQLSSERWPVKTAEDLHNPAMQLQAIEYVAAIQLHQLSQKFHKAGGDGNFDKAFQSVLIEAYSTSNAHCRQLLARNFITSVQTAQTKQPAIYAVLKRLSDLFVLHSLEQSLASLLEVGFVNSSQASLLRDGIRVLLDQIRPDAVTLVDAWMFPDRQLQSALARTNEGNIYQHLYDWAQQEPLNQDDSARIAQFIQPILHQGRLHAAKASKL